MLDGVPSTLTPSPRRAIAATRHFIKRRLAQRKHFPSLNWLISYTKYMRVLEPFFNDFDPVLFRHQEQSERRPPAGRRLTEIVQLVGKESLSEDQKVVMEVAKIIREDFLQQNAFTDYDFTCPLVKKRHGMLKCIMAFYDHCQKAIADSPAEAKVTWATIKVAQAEYHPEGRRHEIRGTERVGGEDQGALRRAGCRDRVVVCGHVGRLRIGGPIGVDRHSRPRLFVMAFFVSAAPRRRPPVRRWDGHSPVRESRLEFHTRTALRSAPTVHDQRQLTTTRRVAFNRVLDET